MIIFGRNCQNCCQRVKTTLLSKYVFWKSTCTLTSVWLSAKTFWTFQKNWKCKFSQFSDFRNIQIFYLLFNCFFTKKQSYNWYNVLFSFYFLLSSQCFFSFNSSNFLIAWIISNVKRSSFFLLFLKYSFLILLVSNNFFLFDSFFSF